MSEQPERQRKRALAEADDEPDDAPRVADAETIARRRIVSVKRTGPADGAAAAPSAFKGAFKSLPGVAPSGAPSLTTALGDGGGAPAPATFSFGARAAEGSAAPSFSFGAAVNSFIEAKRRVEEQRAAEATGADVAAPAEGATAETNALAKAAPVMPATGDVLASIAAKLFVFKSDTKSWAECGGGDAKVKRHAPARDGEGADAPSVYRLIVRDGYSLNAPLNANFHLSKTEDTHAIFTLPTDDRVATYLLKYNQREGEGGAAFSKTLRDTLQLATSNNPDDKK